MAFTPLDWHDRFRRQAAWTESLRRYLFTRLSIPADSRVLEVGCGTGAITASLHSYTQAQIYGLDLNLNYLALAQQNDPPSHFTGGNALRLPFADGAFDVVACHFFLLWVARSGLALEEMMRVTRPGGAVMALAEPDYGGRIDYPVPLAELGRLQAESLRIQGADPEMGRKLSGLFHTAGLRQIQTGLLGGQWQSPPTPEEIDSEWATLESDLAGRVPADRLETLREINLAAWQNGQRVLFVPTFYAMGRK